MRSDPCTSRAHAGPRRVGHRAAGLDEDRRRRRLRGRQDHVRRHDLRDRAVDDRGRHHRREPRHRLRRRGAAPRPAPPSPWTSAGSRSGPTWSSTCSARRARTASWFLWDELVRGAVGGIVLVDTRRIEDCFPAVDYFEHLGIPFVVAVQPVQRRVPRTTRARCARRCSVPANVPVVLCDARNRLHVKETLVLLVEGALRRAQMAASRASTRRGRPAGPQVSCGAVSEPGRSHLLRRDARLPEERRRLRQGRRRASWPTACVPDRRAPTTPTSSWSTPARSSRRARQESIDTVLALADARKAGARLVVTGCMAERYGDELAAALPEVDAVVGFAGEGALRHGRWRSASRRGASRAGCPRPPRAARARRRRRRGPT